MDENKLFEPEPRAGGFFKKQGFYIVLALCLLVVGVAVAVTAFPGNETEPVPSDGQVVQSNQSDDETLAHADDEAARHRKPHARGNGGAQHYAAEREYRRASGPQGQRAGGWGHSMGICHGSVAVFPYA